MKKLLVPALVLALVGVAVAGALHVQSSLCNGVCPLTGQPIGKHHVSAMIETNAVGYGYDAGKCAEGKSSGCPMAAKAAAAAAAAAAEQNAECEKPCEEKQDLDCCRKQVECGKCKPHDAPAETQKP